MDQISLGSKKREEEEALAPPENFELAYLHSRVAGDPAFADENTAIDPGLARIARS
jgi:hypothetical protein